VLLDRSLPNLLRLILHPHHLFLSLQRKSAITLDCYDRTIWIALLRRCHLFPLPLLWLWISPPGRLCYPVHPWLHHESQSADNQFHQTWSFLTTSLTRIKRRWVPSVKFSNPAATRLQLLLRIMRRRKQQPTRRTRTRNKRRTKRSKARRSLLPLLSRALMDQDDRRRRLICLLPRFRLLWLQPFDSFMQVFLEDQGEIMYQYQIIGMYG